MKSSSGNFHVLGPNIVYAVLIYLYNIFYEIYRGRNNFIVFLYHKSTAGDLLKGISVNQMKQKNVAVMLHVIVAISLGSNYLF